MACNLLPKARLWLIVFSCDYYRCKQMQLSVPGEDYQNKAINHQRELAADWQAMPAGQYGSLIAFTEAYRSVSSVVSGGDVAWRHPSVKFTGRVRRMTSLSCHHDARGSLTGGHSSHVGPNRAAARLPFSDSKRLG